MEEALLGQKELQQEVQGLERERDEALQSKRDVGESAKAAQREAAARIVEFSQKNSRLLAELTTLRGV